MVATSSDEGTTFNGSSTDPRSMPLTNSTPNADRWFQWAAMTPTDKLVTSYYDRQHGNDENTGFSDSSMATSTNGVNFTNTRVTSSSMPPPSQFGGVFCGDYTGLADRTDARPLWSDTRHQDLIACPGRDAPGALHSPGSTRPWRTTRTLSAGRCLALTYIG